MAIDRETVLNMWFAGEATNTIAAAVGELHSASISRFISDARAVGDPRAISRQRGLAMRAAGLSNIARFHRRKMLARLPGTIGQLQSALARYTGPITVCPPGVHLGHRAKVLDYFNI